MAKMKCEQYGVRQHNSFYREDLRKANVFYQHQKREDVDIVDIEINKEQEHYLKYEEGVRR